MSEFGTEGGGMNKDGMGSLVGTVSELARLAKRYADVVDGFELDQENSYQMERVVDENGASGTTFSLSQRYLRCGGGRVAYARSECATEPLERLAERAVDLSHVVDCSQVVRLNEPDKNVVAASDTTQMEVTTNPDGTPVLPHSDNDAMDELARRAYNLVCELAPGAMQPSCAVRFYAEGHSITNSSGLIRSGAAAGYQLRCGYISRRGDSMSSAEWYNYAAHPTAFDVESHVRRLILLAESSHPETSLLSGYHPVVMTGQALCRMLMGFWHVFSAQRIAGAQSMLSGHLGKRIGSEALTIVDDPSLCAAPKLAFDAEGTSKGCTTLVDAGMLCEPLSNIASATALGLPRSSGNAARRDRLGRIVPNEVVIAPSCLAILPGQESLDELLARMGDGVLITEVGDIHHGFEFASGSISTPCSGAIVQDGQVTKGIGGLKLGGNLGDLFEHIEAVGSSMSWTDLEYLNAYYTGAPDTFISSAELIGT